MLKLLSLSYLFAATPGQEFRYFWLCLVFFILLIAIGQYIRITVKGSTHKKILKRLLPNTAGHLTWIAFFGFVFLFFRYEDIPYLAMRIWLIAMIIIGLYKLGKIGYIYTKILPQEIDKQYESMDKKKYLPSRRKKKNTKRR